MKKSMTSAYTDMMNNLAKSTAAIPLHLQAAKGALAWWEQPDSLLAKSDIVPAEERLEKAQHKPTYYTYEGGAHCPNCAGKRFAPAKDQAGNDTPHLEGTDREGNEIGAAYSWNEAPDHGVGCDTCGKEIVEPMKKSSAENESDEAYEEDEKKDAKAKKEHDEPDGDEEGEDEDEDGDGEEMNKALGKDPHFAWHKQVAKLSHQERMKFIANNPFPGTEQEYNSSREAYEKKSTKMAVRKLNKQAYNAMAEHGETGDPTKHREAIRLASLAKETRLGKSLDDLNAIADELLAKADTYLKGQTEMFPDMPVPAKTYEEDKAAKQAKKAKKADKKN